MNERIQELIKQCSTTSTSYFDGRGNVTSTVFDKEKFAELIVVECCDILKDTFDCHFEAEQLEEHFGVK